MAGGERRLQIREVGEGFQSRIQPWLWYPRVGFGLACQHRLPRGLRCGFVQKLAQVSQERGCDRRVVRRAAPGGQCRAYTFLAPFALEHLGVARDEDDARRERDVLPYDAIRETGSVPGLER